MSLAMVVGTMIGSGIYLLPTTLAPFGPNLLAAFAITITGTVLLALTFAAFARRMPGGPFVYVRTAFGDAPAFLTLWSYMVSQWTGVAAVAAFPVEAATRVSQPYSAALATTSWLARSLVEPLGFKPSSLI